MLTVRRRVMVLLCIVTAASLAVTVVWQVVERQGMKAVAASAIAERVHFAQQAVALRGQPVQTAVRDCATWNRLAEFCVHPTPGWGRAALLPRLSTVGGAAAWVLDARRNTIFAASTDPQRGAPPLPVPRKALDGPMFNAEDCRFFARTSLGIMEIHAAPVLTETGAPCGFLFVGMRCSPAYLNSLGDTVGASVELAGPHNGASVQYADGTAPTEASFDLTLHGWDSAPVAVLRFRRQLSAVAQIERSVERASLLAISVPLLMLGCFSVLLVRWVSRPLQILSACLRAGDTHQAHALVAENSEFGELARLIGTFFTQRGELLNEVAVRKETEAELLETREKLERRVQDRTAQLAEANAELERKIDEKKQTEEEIRGLNARLEHRYQRIAALRQIDTAITASLDLRLTLGILLDQITTQLRVDAAGFLIANPHSQCLEFTAGKGFRSSHAFTRIHFGEGHAGAAALERRIYACADLTREPGAIAHNPHIAKDEFVSYYAVPLVAKGRVRGVLEVYHRSALEPDMEWLDYLETLAGQAAVAIDNATLFEELQASNTELTQAYDATIEGWSRALDLRDKETDGHSQRVTEMTIALARAMRMPENELVHVRRGALLHDIGKMGIPDSILLKPGPLTDEEWVVMRKHPTYAYELLSPVAFLRPALDVPYCHHEKYDGAGYPRGLKGEQIPLAARIFAVVDVWDALRFDRPYRKGWPDDRVYEHIRGLAGTHFDPRVVELFLDIAPRATAAMLDEESRAA